MWGMHSIREHCFTDRICFWTVIDITQLGMFTHLSTSSFITTENTTRIYLISKVHTTLHIHSNICYNRIITCWVYYDKQNINNKERWCSSGMLHYWLNSKIICWYKANPTSGLKFIQSMRGLSFTESSLVPIDHHSYLEPTEPDDQEMDYDNIWEYDCDTGMIQPTSGISTHRTGLDFGARGLSAMATQQRWS